MGITIKSYRVNIGIFNNKPLHTKTKVTKFNAHHQFTFKKNFKIYTFLCILFFIIQANNFSHIQQVNNNKLSHSTYGNIKHNNIKIAHKGNSKFDNKIDDIHYIIDKHKPLVFQNQRQTTVIPINQSSVTRPLDKFF